MTFSTRSTPSLSQTPKTCSQTSTTRRDCSVTTNAHQQTQELLAAIEQHDREVAAPLRQAYQEERATLVREHRHKELAVFDALEELSSIQSDCRDEYAASRIREVIDNLEDVF